MSQQNPTTFSDVDVKYAIETTEDMAEIQYNMNHKHRGVAIIFNHYEFNDSSLEKREGTDKDVKALKECLPLLGFEPSNIIVENDLTKDEILSYSYRVSYHKREVFQNCDCIAIFILSHGAKEGAKIHARDSDYHLYKLVDQYTPNNFSALTAKPKLFFINASRQCNEDLLSQIDDPDVLISMSSHFAFHEPSDSWYIQDLCKTIQRFNEENMLDTLDITRILVHTSYLLSQRETRTDKFRFREVKQIPNYISTLNRKLCFKRNK